MAKKPIYPKFILTEVDDIPIGHGLTFPLHYSNYVKAAIRRYTWYGVKKFTVKICPDEKVYVKRLG